MTQDDDPYRGNLEAAMNRADALAAELDAERRASDRLRAELAEQARPKKQQKQATRLVDPPPPSEIDLDAVPKLFDDAASLLGFARTTYALYMPVFGGIVSFIILTAGGPLAIVVVLASAMVGIWVAGLVHPTIAGPRERRWVTELPFTVAGLFGLFDGRPSDLRHTGMRIVIWFVDPNHQPTREDVETLWAPGPLDVRIEDHAADGTIRLSAESRRRHESAWGENRMLLRGARHVISTVLLPLHETRPISRVEFRRTR